MSCIPVENTSDPSFGRPVTELREMKEAIATHVSRLAEKLRQLKPLIGEHGIHVYSSNYALYGDLSRRVMSTLDEFSPAVEVYSIDEAFVRLSAPTVNTLEAIAHTLRHTVRQ